MNGNKQDVPEKYQQFITLVPCWKIAPELTNYTAFHMIPEAKKRMTLIQEGYY